MDGLPITTTTHDEGRTYAAPRPGPSNAHADGMLASFDFMEVAAFLIDRQRRVCRSNRAAKTVIGAEIHLRRGRLTVACQTAQRDLDGLLATAAGASGPAALATGGPLRIPACPPAAQYVLYVMQLPHLPLHAYPAESEVRQGVAIVVIKRLDLANPLPAEVLQSIFPFTRREAEVASLLAHGFAAPIIGERLNLTLETVRFYVKSILVKSDCHRQSEFVLVVSRLLDPNRRETPPPSRPGITPAGARNV